MNPLPLDRLSSAVLVACVAASVLAFLAVGVASVAYPYDLNYGEAQIADQARRALAGEPQYKSDLDAPPYVIANYPPLYPLLVGAVRALTGQSWLQTGRAISLLSTLAAAALLGVLAAHLSRRRAVGALSAGLFLANTHVLVWGAHARVDMLGLALSLAGLWLVYRRARSWGWLTVALLCLVGAIYTRQSYLLAAPAAATLWLWQDDRRKAMVFGGALIGVVALLFAALNLQTRGGLYLNTVWVNSLGEFQLRRVLLWGTILLALWPLPVIVAGVGLARAVRPGWRQAADDPDGERRMFALRGLLPYTCGALASALTAGKIGADINYWLELIAALAVWAGLGLAWWPERRRLGQRLASALLAAQILLSLAFGWRAAGEPLRDRWLRLADDHRVFDRVQDAVRRGPVLADDYLGMVVLAGQPIYFQPFDYRQLYVAGRWDPSPLISEVRARRFPLILLWGQGTPVFDERWVPAIVEAIEACYLPAWRVGALVLYEPSAAPCAPP